MSREGCRSAGRAGAQGEGLLPWLLKKIRRMKTNPSRMAVLERMSLAPRHSLTLVEVERRRFLIATSADGALAMEPLPAVDIQLEPWLSDSLKPERRATQPAETHLC